jgi:spore coat polysaccharide biosynthesis protein SpsF
MNKFETEQELFWAGEFGDEYIERNTGERGIAANIALFSKIFSRTQLVSSVMEFGANIGLNLIAIRRLIPNINLFAIEINRKAVNELRKIKNLQIYQMSVLEYNARNLVDLVLSKGFLIHVHPTKLKKVYEIMYRSTLRYICLIEYYNPTPLEVEYRGHKGKLFKRDFAGEMMGAFKDLSLVDYGFVYRHDPNFPQDDINWFLLEKK